MIRNSVYFSQNQNEEVCSHKLFGKPIFPCRLRFHVLSAVVAFQLIRCQFLLTMASRRRGVGIGAIKNREEMQVCDFGVVRDSLNVLLAINYCVLEFSKVSSSEWFINK